MSKTSILIKIVDSETNIHYAAIRLDFQSLDTAVRALKLGLPLILVHGKLSIEQMNIPLDLGVKLK